MEKKSEFLRKRKRVENVFDVKVLVFAAKEELLRGYQKLDYENFYFENYENRTFVIIISLCYTFSHQYTTAASFIFGLT